MCPRDITGWLQLLQLVMKNVLALCIRYQYRLSDANALVSRTTGLCYKCESRRHKFKAKPKSTSTHSKVSLLQVFRYIAVLLWVAGLIQSLMSIIDAKTAALPLLGNLHNYSSHSDSDECLSIYQAKYTSMWSVIPEMQAASLYGFF